VGISTMLPQPDRGLRERRIQQFGRQAGCWHESPSAELLVTDVP
jgi:hypothetical protein